VAQPHVIGRDFRLRGDHHASIVQLNMHKDSKVAKRLHIGAAVRKAMNAY
jgi:hypothetical protein